ncbi:MAG: ATP-binding protein [Desulfobacteraceae bacterium]|jgi:predicted AAA+ superfamily ATPase|nr:ATP-binding protein [Desulfobacteraceae bacterium]
MLPRPIYSEIWNTLSREKNMVFMAGPRQVGKTTLAQNIARSFVNSFYFNWDIPDHRVRLIENPAFFEEMERKDTSIPLVVFDEIHKYRDWKNYLKGVYDEFHHVYQFLISGSGRLDTYQKGGDSLAGRYFLFHLWPFTIAEFGDNEIELAEFLKDPFQVSMERYKELHGIWSNLSELSGFPEPYLSGRKTSYRRWSNTYSRQLIREDIRDLTGIKSIGDMETLYYLLPSKVGSPISIPALSRDLKIAYNTIRSWLTAFQSFFMVFSLSPWTRRIARAIQKEQKLYLWDAPRIKDSAARFENMVAMELYRAVSIWNDMGYGNFSLHFIKNKEQQEVDFLVANANDPIVLIEAKLMDTQPSAALIKFQNALRIPAVQLVDQAAGFRKLSNNDQTILIAPACQWLAGLP